MSTKIEYDGVTTCALSVSNLEASLAWYQTHLGLELCFKVMEMGWAELQTPTANLTLGLSQVEKVEGKGGATVVFGVKDIDKVRAQLEAGQVQFDGDTMVIPEMTKLATFFDPDGNTLMLAQDLSS